MRTPKPLIVLVFLVGCMLLISCSSRVEPPADAAPSDQEAADVSSTPSGSVEAADAAPAPPRGAARMASRETAAARYESISPTPSSDGSITLRDCLVALIEQASVPAQEAGVLVELKAREGQQVEAGELLALIDDAKTKMEVRVAAAKLEVAREKATDDISIQYSNAAHKVAVAEYNVNLEANRREPGTVPKTELEKLRLKTEETRFGILKSEMEKRMAGHEAKVAEAEVDAAQENLNRRRIVSPLGGVIVELHRHKGEWVQPGDQLLRVIRMDRLWVEGFVRAGERARWEIEDRPVTVQVELRTGAKRVPIEGKIVFVRPMTEAGGTYLVRAEIINRQERNHWVLNPGMPASMTIHLQ